MFLQFSSPLCYHMPTYMYSSSLYVLCVTGTASIIMLMRLLYASWPPVVSSNIAISHRSPPCCKGQCDWPKVSLRCHCIRIATTVITCTSLNQCQDGWLCWSLCSAMVHIPCMNSVLYSCVLYTGSWRAVESAAVLYWGQDCAVRPTRRGGENAGNCTKCTSTRKCAVSSHTSTPTSTLK